MAGVATVRALEDCCGEGVASFEAPLRRAPQDAAPVLSTHPPHAEALAPARLQVRTPFALKWPNDVLAGGAKLAGIGLAAEAGPGGRAVAVGIGVNVAAAPDGLPYRATSLTDIGCGVAATELFERLTANWVDIESLWRGGRGFDEVRRLWLDRAAGLGEPVAVRTGPSVARGRFETIDSDGQLVIRTTDGTARRVSAGEVYFGAAASTAAEAVL